MINRKEVVSRNSPQLRFIETESPLSLGNGSFCFTADVTGMQSLGRHYEENHVPLCTMGEWGWHSTPAGTETGCYTLADLEHTVYTSADRTVEYPVDRKAGNEHVYDWLRHNPHKFNLACIALFLDGKAIKLSDISDIKQSLHLYEGRIESSFRLNGKQVKIISLCDMFSDTLAFSVESDANVSVRISFPYGHHEKSGSDWHSPAGHSSFLEGNAIRRVMDNVRYFLFFNLGELGEAGNARLAQIDEHCFEIKSEKSNFNFSIQFTESSLGFPADFLECYERTRKGWESFWSRIGIADFSKAKDPRAPELERRMILSLYLSRIQGCGRLPPAETGLTLNSWYGRFHLEMHLWHSAYLPLYNHADLLQASLQWYKTILPQAKENAAKNAYKGARWPKQVSYDGIDSPSIIAPLLVWQQPHIMYMLELLYMKEPENEHFLSEYWPVIKESADFICDFLHLNEDSGKYELIAPLIPAQEVHKPTEVKNPCFELEYFHFGLGIAIKWAMRLGLGHTSTIWGHVRENIAESPISGGLYLAHENCPATFESFNRDHPSMLCAFGLIPGERIKPEIMKATLEKVISCWNMKEMWGWDFAVMAMTAARLGLRELAIDLLLMDTPKNTYVKSGNNFQKSRSRADLPLYLPGNGSLLLALSVISMPDNGLWDVEFENIMPPY